ncbi:MAG: hypothetical protein IKP54_07450 [Bacteroidales bacterium]|nr:hypothetical protein [Bacteroidales bacterium]
MTHVKRDTIVINDNYAAYINENIDTSVYQKCCICYIDDDTIPELCLFGSCFADGTIILSQHNGVVTRRDCNWSPHYIERSGLIDDGYAHSGLYGDKIIRLKGGVFEEILCTEAVWHEGDTDHPAYFVYTMNGKVVDTLYGEEVNEERRTKVNDAIKQVYSSKGTSKSIYESSGGGYHYVLVKPFRQEVTGWQLEYRGKQYPVKVPGFIHDDLKRNGLLAAGQNEDWIRERVWSYHTSINLKDFPDNRRILVIGGLAGVGEYYVSYSGEETGGVHGYFNYVTSNETFDISYPIERLDVEIIFNRSIAEKVDPRYDIPMADRKAFAKAVSRQDNWRWGQPLPQWGIWRGVFVTN